MLVSKVHRSKQNLASSRTLISVAYTTRRCISHVKPHFLFEMADTVLHKITQAGNCKYRKVYNDHLPSRCLASELALKYSCLSHPVEAVKCRVVIRHNAASSSPWEDRLGYHCTKL